MKFRNEAARDRAWGRWYCKQGARGFVDRDVRSTCNTFRLANYAERRAKHVARTLVTSTLIRL